MAGDRERAGRGGKSAGRFVQSGGGARRPVSAVHVRRHVLDLVQAKALGPGQRLPSIRRLAEETGASLVTAHRAVAGLVSEGVLTSRVGSGTYVAPAARPETRGQVAVVLGGSDLKLGNFVSDLLAGIKSELAERRYAAAVQGHLTYAPEGPEQRELTEVRQAAAGSPAGMIVNINAGPDGAVWKVLRGLACPVVCVNNLSPDGSLPAVCLDNYRGGALAAEHLIGRGHRALGFLHCSERSTSVADRMRGFCETAARLGFPVSSKHVFAAPPGAWGSAPLEEIVGRMMAARPRPTGLLVVNDPVATHCMTLLRKKGVRLPDDLSVVGYDSSEICEHVLPRLASVHQPAFRMGQMAGRLLSELIERRPAAAEPEQIVFTPRLVERDSVRAQGSARP